MPRDASTTLRTPQIEGALFASMISLIGSDRFFDGLASILGEALPFKWVHIFQYSKDTAPVALSNHPRDVAYKRGFENYLNFTYVINPTYRAFQHGANSGVFLISDFIPEGYDDIIGSTDFEIRIEDSESIGYRTPGWPKNMTEFIVLINLPNGTAIDFTFLTEMDGTLHKDHEKRLQDCFPILDAVMNKQFEICPQSFEHHARPGQEERFQDFGGDALTDREREVVQLILVGHNSNSIALKLCVSLSTVKTHRRNIYSKLQISSQAELFSLFLLHLQ
ncbi:LuxR C-terminal-related transcriptional regulator [uncultured Ruegeria sp.]|uniref:helix-turn-helix domain-containing protein n=1 Tax=uncultured Ruegeria sp. TaxID=259304 RepID=UPI00260E7673|nr:LuxR C-terminal-related transcriptional regulator [uncultured Ruegeria sp.]